jgi:arabinan endo-1,5-alpha-L-arabinosidase
VHDPSVVKRGDGSDAGSAFPGGAPWTTTYTGGSRNLWAPDLSYRNARFHLYYSASTFGSRSAIFLATSPSGNSGTWTNRGLVIESRTSDNFNASTRTSWWTTRAAGG